MYFFLAIAAAFFYSLQGSLMASVYRSMDRLSAISYRGLSVGITMLPFLFLVPLEAFLALAELSPLLLMIVAIVLTSAANLCAAECVSVFIVGISSLLMFTAAALFGIAIDSFWLSNYLNTDQWLFLLALFLALIFLTLGRNTANFIHSGSVSFGIFTGVMFGLLIAITYVMVGDLSKLSHPILVGYFWEFGIGIVGVLVAFLRGAINGKGLEPVSLRKFGKILLYSSPTVLGTACYMSALMMGPLAVVASLLSVVLVFSTFFGWLFYGERISMKQLLLIVVITGIIAGLKVVS